MGEITGRLNTKRNDGFRNLSKHETRNDYVDVRSYVAFVEFRIQVANAILAPAENGHIILQIRAGPGGGIGETFVPAEFYSR